MVEFWLICVLHFWQQLSFVDVAVVAVSLPLLLLRRNRHNLEVSPDGVVGPTILYRGRVLKP